MENAEKIYFSVQDVDRRNCGYKTYTTTVTNVTNYREEDFKKAVRHFKKRKHNDIIMHKIRLLDDIPYVEHITAFGELVTTYKNDTIQKKTCI